LLLIFKAEYVFFALFISKGAILFYPFYLFSKIVRYFGKSATMTLARIQDPPASCSGVIISFPKSQAKKVAKSGSVAKIKPTLG
jgi:hypothetical protein